MADGDRINRPDDPKGPAAPANEVTQRFAQEAYKEMAVLVLEGVQVPAGANRNIYKDAVPDWQEKADRLFQARDPISKTLADNYFITSETARSEHKPCPLDIPKRTDLTGFTLADGVDKECGELNELIHQYLPDVLARKGRLLDPNEKTKPADPNTPDISERDQWLKETELLAKIGALLIKDDNTLLHVREFNRYNPDPKYRLLDEPILPPADFNHHLPEKFANDLFIDPKTNKPREFNVRQLCEQELLSNLRGDLVSDLDTEERAVLAMHREVLNQELSWWLLSDGDLVKGDDKIAARNQMRDDILLGYKDDFGLFLKQVDALKNNPAFTKESWYAFQRQAMAEIPSTAQARHFLSVNEANLSDDEKKERFWDTRYQTDAELVRENTRLAEWRYLAAIQLAINNGLLFPEAQTTKEMTYLPPPYLTHLRSLRSSTNVNEFRNSADVEDLARRLAVRQLRRELHQPIASASIFDPARSDAAVSRWENGELRSWTKDVYPWTLKYASATDTNEQIDRARRNAIMNFREENCQNNIDARKAFIDIRVPNSTLTLAQRTAASRKVEKLMHNQQAVCNKHEYDQQRDPFRSYHSNNDPLREILESTVNRSN